jgi:hypothetical protein
VELTENGTKVLERYALRGTSKLDGRISGRWFDFRFHSFRDGQGWFDLAVNVSPSPVLPIPMASLAGSAGKDSQPQDLNFIRPLLRAKLWTGRQRLYSHNDPIIGFGTGQYAAVVFSEASWTALRFVPDDTAGHMFARLPVGSAIRWLDSHASSDPARLIDFAATQLSKRDYRHVISVIHRARTMNLNESQMQRVDELSRSFDIQASAGVAKYLPSIHHVRDSSWIDEFLTFRDDFEFAGAAHEVIAAFAELRGRHKDPAKKAFDEARQLFQQGKQNEGYDRYREIVEKYYASPLYRNVKQ